MGKECVVDINLQNIILPTIKNYIDANSLAAGDLTYRFNNYIPYKTNNGTGTAKYVYNTNGNSVLKTLPSTNLVGGGVLRKQTIARDGFEYIISINNTDTTDEKIQTNGANISICNKDEFVMMRGKNILFINDTDIFIGDINNFIKFNSITPEEETKTLSITVDEYTIAVDGKANDVNISVQFTLLNNTAELDNVDNINISSISCYSNTNYNCSIYNYTTEKISIDNLIIVTCNIKINNEYITESVDAFNLSFNVDCDAPGYKSTNVNFECTIPEYKPVVPDDEPIELPDISDELRASFNIAENILLHKQIPNIYQYSNGVYKLKNNINFEFDIYANENRQVIVNGDYSDGEYPIPLTYEPVNAGSAYINQGIQMSSELTTITETAVSGNTKVKKLRCSMSVGDIASINDATSEPINNSGYSIQYRGRLKTGFYYDDGNSDNNYKYELYVNEYERKEYNIFITVQYANKTYDTGEITECSYELI